ncbi:hypothetical protein EVAR_51826_1 [Eumeta japonica]|uniref:Uncharacterized protein n=1 Tax=Eumeta variegata TaxID=151549 RepID=A0A4C2A1G9_EUMVA|nr:hypothetical protein EVAR_51826_1 [Eumeta japonica]
MCGLGPRPANDSLRRRTDSHFTQWKAVLPPRDPPPAGRAEVGARRVPSVRRSFAATAPRSRVPRVPLLPFRFNTHSGQRAACRRVVPPAVLRKHQQRPALAATAMERKLHNFLKERGHLDLLREFEARTAHPQRPLTLTLG